jgi:hypothetical protein
MPQPAEAEQRDLPILRGRIQIEDRAAVAIDDLAGEDEAPGIDLGGACRIGGAQIMRSVRPGQTRDSATEPPLARASMFRAKRFITSVEIRLR